VTYISDGKADQVVAQHTRLGGGVTDTHANEEEQRVNIA
jgi:hypothetical protein